MRLTVEDNPETIKRYGHIKPARGRRTGSCSTRCPGTARHCTLAKAHRGPHVAHGWFNRVVAVWDAGTGAQAVERTVTGTSRSRARSDVRPMRPVGVREALWRLVVRSISSAEEIALLIFFLVLVWFAIDWLRLIMGG